MLKKLRYPLLAGLSVYSLYILHRYAMSYRESLGLSEFLSFAGYIAGAKMVFMLALGASTFGFGSRVFGRWMPDFGSLLEEWLVKTALGAVVVSYAMFGLGLAGLLYAPVGYAVLAAGVALGAREIAGFARRVSESVHMPKPSLAGGVLAALAGYFLISGLYGAYLPPAGFDVLMYHYGVPRLYLEAHRIFPTPDINGSYFPFGIEMLYMLAMLVESDISANLVNYAFMVMAGLAAASFCRRFLPGTWGLAAFAVFVSVPMVVWLMPQAYIEFAIAAYAMLALHSAAASAGRERNWLVISAVFAGFCISIKYTGIVVAGLMSAWVFAESGLIERAGIKQAAMRFAAFLGIAAALALPWYIKNAVMYHNPVYPYLAGFFGNAPSGGGGTPFTLLSGGLADAAIKLARSLWESTLNARAFQMGWENGLGPYFLMFIPGAFIFGKPNRQLGLLMLFSATFYAVLIMGENIRYLTPILPALSVIAAYPIGRLVKDGDRTARFFGYLLVGVFAAAALMSSIPRPKAEGFPSASPAAVDEYYSKGQWSGYLASYDVWKWINSNLPEDAVIFQLWDDASVYFRHRRTLGAPLAWGDNGRQRIHSIRGFNGFGGFLPGEDIISNLKEAGADFLLINANREGRTLPDDPFFNANAKIVLSHKGVFLYSLSR